MREGQKNQPIDSVGLKSTLSVPGDGLESLWADVPPFLCNALLVRRQAFGQYKMGAGKYMRSGVGGEGLRASALDRKSISACLNSAGPERRHDCGSLS